MSSSVSPPALMLFCWQCVAENRARPVPHSPDFGSPSPPGVLSHAFAIFLFVPFALAEASRNFANKRTDKSVWAVLITAPFSLALLFPSIQLAHQYYGHDFWSTATDLTVSGKPTPNCSAPPVNCC